jgi:antitoxin HicB
VQPFEHLPEDFLFIGGQVALCILAIEREEKGGLARGYEGINHPGGAALARVPGRRGKSQLPKPARAGNNCTRLWILNQQAFTSFPRQHPRRPLVMMHESLGERASRFHSAETVGRVGEIRVIARRVGMGKVGLALALLGLGDVHVMGRAEELRVAAGEDFEVVQGEFPAAFEPGVVDQQGAGAVVAVGVDGPVGKDDVRLLGVDQLGELIVARRIHFRAGIDLAREDWAGLENLARLDALGRPNGGGFLRRLALFLETQLATRQVERDDLMTHVGIASHRPARGGFGVVGMAAGYDDLQLGRGDCRSARGGLADQGKTDDGGSGCQGREHGSPRWDGGCCHGELDRKGKDCPRALECRYDIINGVVLNNPKGDFDPLCRQAIGCYNRVLESRRSAQMLYRVPLIFAPQPEGGYTVTSPVLPELITEGDTIEEAYANAQDALSAVLELYAEQHRALPSGMTLPPSGEVVWSDALLESA